jgi:ribonuclease BN (tRNA processing enzyme)
MIEQGSMRVLCDIGPGIFMRLPVESDLIDAVVVSHQHPDHCSDLFAAFHAWTYRPEPRDPVPLYAPQVVWDRVVGFLEQEPPCFDFHPVTTGDRVDFGELHVDFVEMDHSVPTSGSRWEANGRTMFYTGDTGPGGTWREMARDVSVMLSEASYQGRVEDKPWAHHLTAGEAATIAREAGAQSLTLTHIPPYLDKSVSIAEAEAIFDRPVRLAVPGASFDV